MALVYLLNDLVQRSKIKKMAGFHSVFEPHLSGVFQKLSTKALTAIDLQATLKVLDVWKHRELYPPSALAEWRQVLQQPSEALESSDAITLRDFKQFKIPGTKLLNHQKIQSQFGLWLQLAEQIHATRQDNEQISHNFAKIEDIMKRGAAATSDDFKEADCCFQEIELAVTRVMQMAYVPALQRYTEAHTKM